MVTFRAFCILLAMALCILSVGSALKWVYHHIPYWASGWVDLGVGILVIAMLIGVLGVLYEIEKID